MSTLKVTNLKHENSSSNNISLTDTGAVGIGSTSPVSDLSFGETDAVISPDTSDASDNKSVSLAGGGDAATTRGGYVQVYGNEYSSTGGSVDINSGNVANSYVRIQGRSSTSDIRFWISANEKARIDSSGNVGIGQNSVTQFGSAYRTVELKNTDGGAIRFMDGSSTANSNDSIVYHNTSGLYLRANGSRDVNIWTNGSERVKIDNNGYFYVDTMAVGGTANVHWSSSNGQFFVTSSSERFKHDITAYDKGLTELMQLEPKYFVYNDEPGQKQRAGFIAEDFHALGLTEYVEYWNDEDGNATVPSEIGYSNMVAILVKSIQEQQAMIETLEAKVAALESTT